MSNIIQCASNSINLVINLNEIILDDVLQFSFNILKTLLECNEHKIDKIETEILVGILIRLLL